MLQKQFSQLAQNSSNIIDNTKQRMNSPKYDSIHNRIIVDSSERCQPSPPYPSLAVAVQL